MNIIEASGKNVQAAIQNGLRQLGLEDESQVQITVLSEGGFLKNAKVRLERKQTDGEKAAAFLEQVLDKMGFSFVVDMQETDKEIRLNLIGTDSGSIIGYRGEVLDALQYLVSLVVNIGNEQFRRVVVDAEEYRAKRAKTLEQLAKNLEKKVIRTNKYVKLEPMNPYERRIIHTALHGSKHVTTHSEGEEPNRYVVIAPLMTDGQKSEPVSKRKSLNFVYRSEKKKRR